MEKGSDREERRLQESTRHLRGLRSQRRASSLRLLRWQREVVVLNVGRAGLGEVDRKEFDVRERFRQTGKTHEYLFDYVA